MRWRRRRSGLHHSRTNEFISLVDSRTSFPIPIEILVSGGTYVFQHFDALAERIKPSIVLLFEVRCAALLCSRALEQAHKAAAAGRFLFGRALHVTVRIFVRRRRTKRRVILVTPGLATRTDEDDGYAWPVRSACRSGAAVVRRLMLVETVGRVTWSPEGRAPSLPTMGATLSRATVSHLSGTGSLIVWIFAQSPYVSALT